MSSHPRASRIGEPSWEIANLYPRQGAWSESDYLGLEIVDPRDRSITVLGLDNAGAGFDELSRTFDGQSAASRLLAGFAVNVSTVFDRPEVIQ
ncbi:hypothetical protein Mal15_36000 [Stieleria maiorica]|uniref:Uncharacterized protein n=1 Tax=Stieleria maiorica TaxID=2795974 RepID=A0A5B9MIU9_9BACT|nr:hypothetical protein [Stieleria maiorica]QEF99535.1 hypothetical protein Mal15_36000 [Stieleria maiorica]